jgi:hypothetical protein
MILPARFVRACMRVGGEKHDGVPQNEENFAL